MVEEEKGAALECGDIVTSQGRAWWGQGTFVHAPKSQPLLFASFVLVYESSPVPRGSLLLRVLLAGCS